MRPEPVGITNTTKRGQMSILQTMGITDRVELRFSPDNLTPGKVLTRDQLQERDSWQMMIVPIPGLLSMVKDAMSGLKKKMI